MATTVRSAAWLLPFLTVGLGLPGVVQGAYPGEVVALIGEQAGAGAGSVLTLLPDADGDGKVDLAAGLPADGMVYLVLDAARVAKKRGLGEGSVAIDLGQSQSRIALATADLNEDGLSDLIVGTPDMDTVTGVSFFMGRASWPSSLTLADADLRLSVTKACEAGASLAVVPVPSSPTTLEVIVGAPGFGKGAGTVYRSSTSRLFGPAVGTDANLATVIDGTWISNAPGEIRLGDAVAAVGDLDADDIEDLAIAAPQAGGGEIYLALSSGSSWTVSDLEQYPSLEWPTDGQLVGVNMAGVQDGDGDGIDDLLVGAPGDGLVAGQVVLIPGGQAFDVDKNYFAYASMSLFGQDPLDRLGAAVVGLPDVDYDGLGELLVSAPGMDSDKGAVGFFLGSGSLGNLGALADADVYVKGENAGTLLGSSLVGGGVAFVGAPGAAPNLMEGAGEIFGLKVDEYDTDVDSDGLTVLEGDCGEGNAQVHPGAEEVCDGVDTDCDGNKLLEELDLDSDGVPACTGPGVPTADCEDTDPTRYPGATEICDGLDNDCDGVVPGSEGDADGDTYLSCSSATRAADCDDSNKAVYPGAKEICNQRDDDCDGKLSASEQDLDGDGFIGCSTGSNVVDCDDQTSSIYPGASEVCEGKDSDCDGSLSIQEQDQDGDGAPGCAYGSFEADCDDEDPSRAPGAEELCDGLDNDCDGKLPALEADSDSDGFMACLGGEGSGDCDDSNATIYPGAKEACDGLDTNCDGSADADDDKDGFLSCSGSQGGQDCDDASALTYPGATELCDGKDNDCDGNLSKLELDGDGDSFSACGNGGPIDCDDADNTVYPGGTEVCDGKDNDCNGGVSLQESDRDKDGYIGCPGLAGEDCDDSAPTVYPGAPEACDGKDSNCDGNLPSGETDVDLDGVPTCAGDCNDTNEFIYPGAEELCDALDGNCDGQVPDNETINKDKDPYTLCAGDCDDNDNDVYPGAEEVFDEKDNDCNGKIDDVDCPDQDQDGYPADRCNGQTKVDCNDRDDDIYPGAPEGPVDNEGIMAGDGKDNDCDGLVDEDTTFSDDDNDGLSESRGDCNDNNASAYPGHAEVIGDNVDNDCDGAIDEDNPRTDDDGDGYANEDGAGNVLDCNDQDDNIFPGAGETGGNQVDEDCNGAIDVDGDGQEDNQDCNDGDAAIFSGAPEIADDGIDNNCDGRIDELPPGMIDGPGIGCGALASVQGVSVSCTMTPERPRGSIGSLLLFALASLPLFKRRRALQA